MFDCCLAVNVITFIKRSLISLWLWHSGGGILLAASVSVRTLLVRFVVTIRLIGRHACATSMK